MYGLRDNHCNMFCIILLLYGRDKTDLRTRIWKVKRILSNTLDRTINSKLDSAEHFLRTQTIFQAA